jgi:cytochrome P450
MHNRYSVVPVVTRTLKEDDQLEGKTVPAGTMIVCHLQVRPALV